MIRETMRFVRLGTGLTNQTLIPGNVRGSVPSRGVYGVVVLNPGDAMDGLPDTVYRDVEKGVAANIKYQVMERYTLHIYRKGSLDLLKEFRRWAYSPQARLEEERQGFRMVMCGEVMDLSDVYQKRPEERGKVDLWIAVTQEMTQNAGLIDQADVTAREGGLTDRVDVGPVGRETFRILTEQGRPITDTDGDPLDYRYG